MSAAAALNLVTDALATYRLVKLVREDKITEDLRERVYSRYGDPSASKVSYLFTCPWCLSIYAGAFLSVSRIVAPRLTDVVSRALALSATAGIMTEREESRTDGF